MKPLKNIIIAAFTMLTISACNAQIKNKKSETIKIFGNCRMCKKTIEEAGNKNKQAEIIWDKQTKLATISYDSVTTTKEEILQRIALAGYDNELYLAPENAYNGLHSCCQYERKKEVPSTKTEENTAIDTNQNAADKVVKQIDSNLLLPIFENYFVLKDALVQTDAGIASTKAKILLVNLNSISTSNLTDPQKIKWTLVSKTLIEEAKKIAVSSDIAFQRGHFISLSENMYPLIKVSNIHDAVYWQHCPMANNGKGANWLSKENSIKNPYFGTMMLNCGKTIETIK